MTGQLPIACILTDAEMRDRLGQLSALGPAVVAADVADGRALVRFRGDAETRARVDAVVAAERLCCSFLAMDVREADGDVLLTIVGPEGAEPIVAELVAAISG